MNHQPLITPYFWAGWYDRGEWTRLFRCVFFNVFLETFVARKGSILLSHNTSYRAIKGFKKEPLGLKKPFHTPQSSKRESNGDIQPGRKMSQEKKNGEILSIESWLFNTGSLYTLYHIPNTIG